MIRSAFSKLKTYAYRALVQFWAPVKTRGKHLLTTSNQPFAFGDPTNKDISRYRLCSMKYQYNIDVNNIEENPTIIHGSPAATAFRNQMPDLILDLTVHEKTPLVSSALECGLTEAFLLPVFCPSQSFCVGIVECAARQFNVPILIANDFIEALEKAGFKTFRQLKYKTICTLKHTKDEIDEALKAICETHHMDFAQVWIAFDDDNFPTSSSSLKDIQTRRVAGFLTLSNYGVTPSIEELIHFYEYYKVACDACPSKMGEGPVGYTLQTCQTYFIKSVLEWSNYKLMRWDCEDDIECSCFVLSLRSTKTGDLDYAFEFFMHEIQDRVMLLETLVLTLKRCLPSFKYTNGVELGDELSILDVEDNIGSEAGDELSILDVEDDIGSETGDELSILDVGDDIRSETRYFKIFQEVKLSHVHEATEGKRPVVEQSLARPKAKWKTAPISLSRADIEAQFGKTMKEAAKNLNVCRSTLVRKNKEFGILEWPGKGHDSKRKENESYNYQSNKNKDRRIQDLQTSNDGEMNLDDTLTFKAMFDETIKFDIPLPSATLATIQKKIKEGFKLNHDNYKLQYLDEEEDWISINIEEHMERYINSRGNLASNVIRLRLLHKSDPSNTYQIT